MTSSEPVNVGSHLVGYVSRLDRPTYDGRKYHARLANDDRGKFTKTKGEAVTWLSDSYVAKVGDIEIAKAVALSRFSTEDLIAELTARTNEGQVNEVAL